MINDNFGHVQGRIIRVDQDDKLARDEEWMTMALKPAGVDSPSQNRQATRCNKMIATKMRILLYCAQMAAQYWSAVVVHVMYIINKRVQSKFQKISNTLWWDMKSDLSTLKVFGPRVYLKPEYGIWP